MQDNKAFYTGALSGFIVRLVTQPFDVLKIRFQLQVEPISKECQTSYYRNMFQASKRIYSEEGIFGFWKGHIPAQFLSIVFGAVQFQTYESLYMKTGVPRSSLFDILFGGIAGSTASLICQPIDVIRTRLVSQGKHKKYNGIIQAILDMSKQEGIYGFFRGNVPTLLLIFPQTALQFCIYHKMNNFLTSRRKLLSGELNELGLKDAMIKELSYNPYNSLISGCIAGVVAKGLVYPLDLAKRRLQVQGFEEPRLYFGQFHRSLRFADSIRKTIMEEGFFSLYKGLLPSSIKSGVVSSLTFYFYELFSKIL